MCLTGYAAAVQCGSKEEAVFHRDRLIFHSVPDKGWGCGFLHLCFQTPVVRCFIGIGTDNLNRTFMRYFGICCDYRVAQDHTVGAQQPGIGHTAGSAGIGIWIQHKFSVSRRDFVCGSGRLVTGVFFVERCFLYGNGAALASDPGFYHREPERAERRC